MKKKLANLQFVAQAGLAVKVLNKSNTALTETNKTKRLTQLKSNNDILMIY